MFSMRPSPIYMDDHGTTLLLVVAFHHMHIKESKFDIKLWQVVEKNKGD